MPSDDDPQKSIVSKLLTSVAPPSKAYFYRPASIWMVPAFLISFLLIGGGMASAIRAAWRFGQDAGIENLFSSGLITMLSGSFMLSLATLNFLVATGYFVAIGDGGIHHVENLEALNFGPVVTTLNVTHRKLNMTGKEVKIWKWGRLGGVRGVVSGGGPRDGYIAVCVVRWFEDSKGVVQDGYKPTDDEMRSIEREYPGMVWSNLLVIPMQPWRCYTAQLPMALRLKIEHDWKWTPDSPVQVMYDTMEWRVERKQEHVPGAVIELWGMTEAFNRLTREHQALALSYAKLSSTYTMTGVK